MIKPLGKYSKSWFDFKKVIARGEKEIGGSVIFQFAKSRPQIERF